MVTSAFDKSLWPFAVGAKVQLAQPFGAPIGLVVDVNPQDVCTPYPCVMVAWKEGRKTHEGVIETKYLRLANVKS